MGRQSVRGQIRLADSDKYQVGNDCDGVELWLVELGALQGHEL